jgi:hypothetical protein
MIMRAFLRMAAFMACVIGCLPAVHGQGTAFTYQGRLIDNGGTPAGGLYDIAFSLYNSQSNGDLIASSTNLQTPVSNGVFSVVVDLGSVFDGTPSWLEIGVRSNGESAFTALSPRQPVTSAPYAITSLRLSAPGLSEVLALSQSNVQTQVSQTFSSLASSNAQSVLTLETNIAVNAAASAVSAYAQTNKTAIIDSTNLMSGNYSVTCWGDSLTAGGNDGTGVSYPNVLSTNIAMRVVNNEGVGGQSSTQIGVRMGAIPTTCTVSNNLIPASGSIAITFASGREPMSTWDTVPSSKAPSRG